MTLNILRIKILRSGVWGSAPGRRVQLRQAIRRAGARLQDPAEDNRGVNPAPSSPPNLSQLWGCLSQTGAEDGSSHSPASRSKLVQLGWMWRGRLTARL